MLIIVTFMNDCAPESVKTYGEWFRLHSDLVRISILMCEAESVFFPSFPFAKN